MMSSTRTMIAFAAASCFGACAGATAQSGSQAPIAKSRVWQFSSSASAGHEITPEPPALFVHVDKVADPSHTLPDHAREQATVAVQRAVASGDFDTAWPGELPRSQELELRGSRAFIVAATVHEVTVDRAAIRCRVGVRVAPWHGVDGGERWDSESTATAMGSARVIGASANGVRDCVNEVVESVVAKRIVPFLRGVTRATGLASTTASP